MVTYIKVKSNLFNFFLLKLKSLLASLKAWKPRILNEFSGCIDGCPCDSVSAASFFPPSPHAFYFATFCLEHDQPVKV